MPTGFVAAAERVNVAADGSEADQPATGNWNSLSDDGRFAVFSSAAANLVAGDSNGVADVFVRDRQTGTTSRVSMASNGSEADGPSGAAVISGNGRYVAFQSQAGNLVAGDTNAVTDVFLHDRQAGSTTRLSVSADGTEGNGPSSGAGISGDGRVVLYGSAADNLVAGDDNGVADVFVQVMTSPDTTLPQITLKSPALTKQAAYTLSGFLDEAATLSVSGQTVVVAQDLTFQHDLTLAEGDNVLQLVATDGAGNSALLDFSVTLDSIPPAAPDPGLIQISPPDAAGQVSVSGGASSVEPGGTVTVTNLRTGETVTVSADAAGAFTASLGGQSGDSYQIIVEDGAGNQSAVTAGVGLPPDPAAIAPPMDLTLASDLYSATAFLYTGAGAVQTGVTAGTIEPRRVAVIRGRMLGRDNAPLAGVTLTVKDHPEYGRTLSRADGQFDLAVNGGGTLVLNYQKPGYLPVQRKVNTPWRDYAWAEDVVLIPLDGIVTLITAGSPDMQMARGGMVADGDGSRQATLLFPAGTTAEMVMADGSRQPLAQLNVRATEYTVGDNGPQAMPGELPPASGYTYAVELSVDEAIAAGARKVQFNQPVIFYLENFLGFPAGEPVPTGWYDREQAAWIPLDNGRVVEILAVSGALAVLDLDGDGLADDGTALVALGISDAERAQLASLYTPGQRLWRVPVTHFTPWDHNWSLFDDEEKR